MKIAVLLSLLLVILTSCGSRPALPSGAASGTATTAAPLPAASTAAGGPVSKGGPISSSGGPISTTGPGATTAAGKPPVSSAPAATAGTPARPPAGPPSGHDRLGAERAAISAALQARAVPVRDGRFDDPARYCKAERLSVTWSRPAATYRYGSYQLPLGPPPTATTSKVNGIVLCQGATYAYAGFEARWDDLAGRWSIQLLPSE